jgi:hypothetical protein
MQTTIKKIGAFLLILLIMTACSANAPADTAELISTANTHKTEQVVSAEAGADTSEIVQAVPEVETQSAQEA